MRAGAALKPAAYPKIETARVVVLITPEQLSRIDAWGVGKGKQNRTEAIRSLVDIGLEAELKQQGAAA